MTKPSKKGRVYWAVDEGEDKSDIPWICRSREAARSVRNTYGGTVVRVRLTIEPEPKRRKRK